MRAPGILIAAAWLAGCGGGPAIEITDLTLNNAPPTAPMRAGYLSITNNSDTDVRLVSARSSAFGKIEFHRSSTVDGQARMRREESVPIAAGDKVVLEPFGLHLMLMIPAQPPIADAKVAVELCFDNASCLTSRVTTP
jgi:hypothetical protein